MGGQTLNNYLSDIVWKYKDDVSTSSLWYGSLIFKFKAKTDGFISLFAALNEEIKEETLINNNLPYFKNSIGAFDFGRMCPVSAERVDWQVGHGCSYVPRYIFPLEKDKEYEFLIKSLTFTAGDAGITNNFRNNPSYGEPYCRETAIFQNDIRDFFGRDFNDDDYLNLRIEEYDSSSNFINAAANNGEYGFFSESLIAQE